MSKDRKALFLVSGLSHTTEDPVYSAAESLQMPVVSHPPLPLQCFLPVEWVGMELMPEFLPRRYGEGPQEGATVPGL
ncbi:MAG: hypothetical protein Greene041619_814 [Candidatus Peregrinibacteria bacterium Greene0416_19]|nr:MAG: hypothetical protein Greene041619_814 [Candidatus Peregrinibacteria bacterium Greene0416_19]